MSVEQIAAYLNMSPSTIYQRVARRQIPFSKVPHSSLIRFDLEKIDKWLEDNAFETEKEYLKGGDA
jgi:excisionase family DNA binding protein